MSRWKNDEELFDTMRRELFSAVLGDVLDVMGRVHQILPSGIRPLREDTILIGRAMPVLEADCSGIRVHREEKDAAFGAMFEALDSLRPGEIYLCAGGSPRYALWGELMSTRAIQLGAAGAIVDGFHRDTRGIQRLGFSTFSRGSYAQDQGVRGRVIDHRCPLEFSNAVLVEPGDLIFGDLDGIVTIPRSIEDQVVEAALEKVRGENLVRKAIETGMSTVEAFRRFGIM